MILISKTRWKISEAMDLLSTAMDLLNKTNSLSTTNLLNVASVAQYS